MGWINLVTITDIDAISTMPSRSAMATLVVFILMTTLCVCQGRKTTAAFSFRGGGNAVKLFVSTVKEARKHLTAAAVARSVSVFAMYPVDTIKTRMQMDQANPLRTEGLLNGVGGSLFGQVPYG